jgi:hypothetical protein
MIGLTRDEKHRYRWMDGHWCPGVTGIIKSLDKSGPLVGWAKRETAACAIRNLPLLTQMVTDGGPTAAVEWLKRTPDYQRDTSADLGSRIHLLAEAIGRGHEVEPSEDEVPYLDAYRAWMAAAKPDFVNVEFMVYSEQYQYGGTADAVVRLAGDLWLIDYKTSKGVYSETALQLVAYARADWAGRANDPVKYAIPKVTRYGVLHIRPEGAELVEFDIGPDEWQAFRALRELRGWLDARADHVIAQTLEAA